MQRTKSVTSLFQRIQVLLITTGIGLSPPAARSQELGKIEKAPLQRRRRGRDSAEG